MHRRWFWYALASALAMLASMPAMAGAAVTEQQLQEAVGKTVSWFHGQQESDGALGVNGGLDPAWALLGLAGAGVNAADLSTGLGQPSAQDYYLEQWTGPNDKAWTSVGTPQASDYERVIMLAKAAGLDPLRLSSEQNLLAKLAGFDNKGLFAPKGTFNQTMFALIALDQLPVPDWLVQQIAGIVEANAHEDGGYTYSTVESQQAYERAGEIDLTGAAIAALCGAGRTTQSPAVAKAIKFLEEERSLTNGQIGNIDSTSWALDGMGACGVKRGSPEWNAEDEHTIEWLLSQQLPNGAWPVNGIANAYATQDALRALDAPGFDVEAPPRLNPGEPAHREPPSVPAGTPVPVVLAIDAGFGDIRLCSTTAPAGATLPEVLAAAHTQSNPTGCVSELQADADGISSLDGAVPQAGSGAWKLSLDDGAEQTAADQSIGFGEVVGLRLEDPAPLEPGVGNKAPGRVFVWGENNAGQLGLGTTTGPQICGPSSEEEACAPTPTAVPGILTAKGVAAGESHSLIVKADGTVLAAGGDAQGQLGNGTTTSSSTFASVPGISSAVQVAAGRRFSLTLLADGKVMAWGENEKGELGLGTATFNGTEDTVIGPEACGEAACSSTPVTVPGITTATQIAAGENFALALLSDGEVMAWGEGIEGELGNNTNTSPSPTPTPVTLTGFTSKVVQISAGRNFAFALLEDGEAIGWGAREECNWLGDGDNEALALTPVKVQLPSAGEQISGGFTDSLAVLTDGDVAAWGCNSLGSLGIEGLSESRTPATISGLSNVVEVANGLIHSFARTSDGTVWAWGYGPYGLGDGTAAGSPVPVQTKVTGAIALAQGPDSYGTLAIVPAKATAGPETLAFGTQAQDTIGAAHTVTVTAGSEPLQISSARTTGADASDFIVSGDECSGETLQPGAECTLAVRFAPAAVGSRSASLIVHTNAAGNPAIALSGEGGQLPAEGKGEEGEPGKEGDQGQHGEQGAQGASGQQGQAGAHGERGPVGASGERGPQGAAGARGPAGRDATVICRLAKSARKVACSVTFKGKKTARTAHATLIRDGRIYARGSLASLRSARAIQRGAYTLRLRVDAHTVAIEVKLP